MLSKNTENYNKLNQLLSEMIETGRNNLILYIYEKKLLTNRELATAAGLKERQFYSIIERARKNGKI